MAVGLMKATGLAARAPYGLRTEDFATPPPPRPRQPDSQLCAAVTLQRRRRIWDFLVAASIGSWLDRHALTRPRPWPRLFFRNEEKMSSF